MQVIMLLQWIIEEKLSEFVVKSLQVAIFESLTACFFVSEVAQFFIDKGTKKLQQEILCGEWGCLSIHFTDVCVNMRAETISQRFANLDRNAVKSCRR